MNQFKSSLPMYQQISEFIKNQIIEGVYKEGTKIPTEIELMEQFKVSRTTVRLAIKEIMKNDFVKKVPGKGTFVNEGKVYHNLEGFKGLYETLLDAGIVPETELLEFQMITASDKIMHVLDLTKRDKVLKVLRLYHVNGNPISLAQITLHPNYSNLISKDEASKHPVYQLISEKKGFDVKQANFEIFSENCSEEVANALQIQKHDAVLGAERVLYTEDHHPIEHSLLWFRSDSYRFTVELKDKTMLQLKDLSRFKLKVDKDKL